MAAKSNEPANRRSNDAVTEAIGDDGRINDTQNGAGELASEFDPGSLSITGADDNAGTDEFVRDDFGNIKRNKDGSPRKKRGRKAGGSTTSKSPARNNSPLAGIETLAQSLMIVHLGLASFTKFDEFALSDKEAQTLSTSIVTVMSEFDITPDPRILAVTGLITTASMIYGPRIYNYTEYRAKERKKKDNAEQVAHAPSFNSVEFFTSGNVPVHN